MLAESWNYYTVFCMLWIPIELKVTELSPRNDLDFPRLDIKYTFWITFLTEIISDNTHLVIFNKPSKFQFLDSVFCQLQDLFWLKAFRTTSNFTQENGAPVSVTFGQDVNHCSSVSSLFHRAYGLFSVVFLGVLFFVLESLLFRVLRNCLDFG